MQDRLENLRRELISNPSRFRLYARELARAGRPGEACNAYSIHLGALLEATTDPKTRGQLAKEHALVVADFLDGDKVRFAGPHGDAKWSITNPDGLRRAPAVRIGTIGKVVWVGIPKRYQGDETMRFVRVEVPDGRAFYAKPPTLEHENRWANISRRLDGLVLDDYVPRKGDTVLNPDGEKKIVFWVGGEPQLRVGLHPENVYPDEGDKFDPEWLPAHKVKLWTPPPGQWWES